MVIFLVAWVMSAIYLSINSIFGIFVETNPNIAKSILAYSFIGLITTLVINKTRGGDLTKMSDDLKDMQENRKQKGCKTCKQKN